MTFLQRCMNIKQYQRVSISSQDGPILESIYIVTGLILDGSAPSSHEFL